MKKYRKVKKNHYSFKETNIISQKQEGLFKTVLIYPNTYYLGMSNLGFQTVYKYINKIDKVICERAFLQDTGNGILSIESKKPIKNFDLIAFSISFENDYINILKILDAAKIPLKSRERKETFPLIIAGGVACTLNPEPISPFIDCFFIGESEEFFPSFFSYFNNYSNKKKLLHSLVKDVPGIYVPCFYNIEYKNNGTIKSFYPLLNDFPNKVKKVYPDNLKDTPTCTAILTPNTSFSETFLIEVGRGCPHGCRFCSAGYIYRPPRFRSLSLIKKCIDKGSALTNKIGLISAAVSDLPQVEQLCASFANKNIQLSFSSFRADSLTKDFISILKQNKVKTATIAPEAGSERMRQVINKGLDEHDILEATTKLVQGDIPNLKLYFMIGLPTEKESDIDAIIELCQKIKDRFLKASKPKKHIGTITVSINPFIPKPVTPFQWAGMESIQSLKKKIKKIHNVLKKIPNLTVNFENPQKAYIQALLSRGDRKIAALLLKAYQNNLNWKKTLKESDIDPAFYVYREREATEIMPWDFIDHKVDRSFLYKEYIKGKSALPSPVCSMSESCQMCGACKK